MLLNAIWIIIMRLYEKAIDSFGILTDRYDLYAAFVTITSVISLFLIIYVIFKMEKNRLFYGFLFLLAMISIWIYSDLQKYLAISNEQIMFWIRIEYLARLYTAVAWYVFAEVYTKRNNKINTKFIFVLLFTATILFTLFPLQDFNVKQARTLHANNLQMIIIYFSTVYVSVISLVKLNRFALKQKGVYIKQVQLITAGLFFVLPIDIIAFLDIAKLSFDPIPAGFVMLQFFIWKAVTKYKLMELVPIALREVFNNMSDGVIVLNEDGSIIDMNNTAKKWIGSYYNARIDINIFDIIINLSSKIDNPYILLEQVKEAVGKADKPMNLELKFKDSTPRYFSVHAGPILNNGKRTIGHIVNIDDITEYKLLLLQNEEQNFMLHEQNNELEAQKEELEAQKHELMEVNKQLEQAYKQLQETQAQLIQTEKMAALGQLVAGVAHEINTPLGSINSNIETTKLIATRLMNIAAATGNAEAQRLIEKFNKMNDINTIACGRILEIVRSLKNFSRLDEAEFQKAKIHDGIDSTLILLNSHIKNRLIIHKNYGSVPEIECYPNQLNQVFMNILVNAAQAIEGKGEIYINTYAEENAVFIEFIDSGKGISKEYLDRVFDPGFTTKGVGVGTGLGLSITYKIIQKHNGSITVENTENLGAKFTIKLPISNIGKPYNSKKH